MRLESPLFPVTEGEDVTLRCRHEMSSFNVTAHFYRDDVLITSTNTGIVTIHHVSKSDKGLYKCNISGVGESPINWLNVKGETITLKKSVCACVHKVNTMGPENFVPCCSWCHCFTHQSPRWLCAHVLWLVFYYSSSQILYQ